MPNKKLPFNPVFKSLESVLQITTFRGIFRGEFGVRHCNQWGLYGARVRQRRDAALFLNYFGQTCFLWSCSYLFTFLLFSQFCWCIRWKSTAYFFESPCIGLLYNLRIFFRCLKFRALYEARLTCVCDCIDQRAMIWLCCMSRKNCEILNLRYTSLRLYSDKTKSCFKHVIAA